MPTYFALGTRISLRVWDPKQANEQPLDGQFDHAKVKGPPRYKLLHNVDPAAGYMVETLKEEYYEGHGGVHFLGIGCDMPFYLVRAGSDLFPTLTPMPLLEHQAHTMSAPLVVKSGTESFLSTVSRSLFVNSSPIAGLNGKDEVEKKGPIAGRNLHKDASHKPPRRAIPKPLRKPLPLQIRIDLSQKSFMPSIFTDKRQELCISIFYNGELTQSRILKRGDFVGEDPMFASYSGRRIDSWLEVPWLLSPAKQYSSTRSTSSNVKSSSFEQIWNAINQKLFIEANEWGMEGKHPSVMGEYLQALATKHMPESLKSIADQGSTTAGIIDVVITLGKSVTINASGLRAPRRKLHEDVCGKDSIFYVAPPELRPKKNTDMIEDIESETFQTQNQRDHQLDASNVAPQRISRASNSISCGIENKFAETKSQTEIQSISSSIMAPPPATPLREQQRHGPKNLPQKTYKGNDPPVYQGNSEWGPNHFSRSLRSSSRTESGRVSGVASPSTSQSRPEQQHDTPNRRFTIRSSQDGSWLRVLDSSHSVGQHQIQSRRGARARTRVLFSARGKQFSAEVDSEKLLDTLGGSRPKSLVMDRRISYTTAKISPMNMTSKPVAFTEKSPLGEFTLGGKPLLDFPDVSGTAGAHISTPMASQHPTTKTRIIPARSRSISAVSDTSGDSNQHLSKKPRRRRDAMSTREMNSLFEAHRPGVGVDGTLGASLMETSRSTRNMKSTLQPLSKPKMGQTFSSVFQESENVEYQGFGVTVKKLPTRKSIGHITTSLKSSVEQKASMKSRALASGFSKPSQTSGVLEDMTNSKRRSYSKSSHRIKMPDPRKGTTGPAKRLMGVGPGLKFHPFTDSSPLKSSPGESIVVHSDTPLARFLAPTPNLKLESKIYNDTISDEWAPDEICQNSVLMYASSKNWNEWQKLEDVKIDANALQLVRTVKAEREGVFRASGVLMGVRFVVGI